MACAFPQLCEKKTITIRFNEKPVPRQSHRTSFRGGSAVTFDPQSNKLLELRAMTWCQLEDGHEPWSREIPVVVSIQAVFAIPASWPKQRRAMAFSGEECHTHVPDCDNMAKLYMDAIKGIVFDDDAQVVGRMVGKSYAEKPAVVITCTWMEHRHEC